MLCDGGEKEWAQMMGERPLVIPANTNSSNSSATCSGNKNGMIRANSGAAINAAARVADKPPPSGAQDHLPPPAASLRCPRCDSSNTKFCYYNNYSLSQPRHFCKACKRYWTRGGTLRNVPVGGGCRKNKRSKKPPAAAPPPPHHPQIPSLSAAPRSAAAASHLDAAASAAAMFAMPILPNGFSASTSAFDLPSHHLGALGLGLGEFQPLPATESCSAAISSTLLSDYPPLYSLSSSLLLPSISRQPKQVEDYQVLLPFEELQASAISGSTINGMMREVKLESGGQHNIINSCIDWQIQMENSLDSFAPPASMYWNGGSAGWPDGGSSVAPPLI